MNIVKYWKNHTGLVILIILLLVVQAYCDLALPSYTADIVDVGITNGGIEYAVPQKLREETFEKICLFLTDEQRQTVEENYRQTENGNYRLQTENEKTKKKLDDMMGMAIMMVSGLSIPTEDGSVPLEQMQMVYEAGKMDRQEFVAMAEKTKESMGDYGGSIIKSQAVSFIKDEYRILGVNTSKIQRQYLAKKGLFMLGYSVTAMITAIMIGLMASVVAAGVGQTMRGNVFKRVLSFSNAEIDRFQTSSLITRCTNDIQQIQTVTVILLRMVFYAPVLALGGIVKVLRTNTGLEWIIVLAVVVIVGFVLLLVAIAMPKFRIMQTLVDRLNLIARELLTGVLVIRAFGREEEEEKRFDAANRELTGTQLFTNRVMTFMMPIMMLIMNGVTVLIVWMGAKGIDSGRLQVGDMMAFITYTMQIIISFLMLTMISIILPRASVAAKRIEEILQTDSSITDAVDCEKADQSLSDPKGVLTFEHVNFRYPGASDDALSDIDFVAKPGTTTAIIGSTGCGKSTLIHLITRFYDVTQGSVRIDGVDIREISQHKLREMLGFVPQKGVLFSGDIASNIQFAGDFVTEEDMKMAASIAQADEFIQSKPETFHSEIAQGGTNVSGGQKQRLSIARAVAKKPKIFLFDDSFSALDYKTDAALRKALREQLKETTVLIVAQRISTILHADTIIVLDEGKIVGMGTHEMLLKDCEAYREIARSQLSENELKGGR